MAHEKLSRWTGGVEHRTSGCTLIPSGRIDLHLRDAHEDRGDGRIRKGPQVWDNGEAWTRFLKDPRIPLTNAEAERAIR